MTRTLTLACLLVPVFGLRADPPKESDLAAKVAALEKRVAELEAALKRTPPADPGKTEIANKVVGNWTVADDNLKDAVFTDLVLRTDGKCEFVVKEFGPRVGATYIVVGKQLSVTYGVETWNKCRVATVSEKELVLEHTDGDNVKRVKYNREK
jgi:hypothetical protein